MFNLSKALVSNEGHISRISSHPGKIDSSSKVKGIESSIIIFRSFPIRYNLTAYFPFGLYIGIPSFCGYILNNMLRLVFKSVMLLSRIN